jgi:hypothetical protein
MHYVFRSWATLRLSQTLSSFGRSASSTNNPLKANVRCRVLRLILETRTCTIRVLTSMVPLLVYSEGCMTSVASYHSCQVRRLPSLSSYLADSTSKMTVTFNPVYCTSRTDGSQRAISKHNLSHPFKVLQAGIHTPQIWALSADSITSKLLVER